MYTEHASDAINKNGFEKLANYCIDCAKSNKKRQRNGMVERIDV